MNNKIYLMKHNKDLQDVQYTMLEQKLEHISESITQIQNTKELSDTFEHQKTIHIQKYEQLLQKDMLL